MGLGDRELNGRTEKLNYGVIMKIWRRMKEGFGGDLIWERSNKKEGKKLRRKRGKGE